jgi:hypothetical protein
MTEQFIHIDSTYRDRSRFPYPGEFHLDTSSSDDIVYPVVLGFPHLSGLVDTVTSTTSIRVLYGDVVSSNIGVLKYLKGLYFDNGSETPIQITDSTYEVVAVYINTYTHITLTTPTAVVVGGKYFIRGELPFASTTVGVGSTVSNIVLAVATLDVYTGMYIRIIFSPLDVQIRRIVTHSGSSVVVDSPFTTLPVNLTRVEIGKATDSVYPLNRGYLCNNQSQYCEIKLLSLTVPGDINVVSQNGHQGSTFDHPYLLVNLDNINSGTTQKVYSNDPNSSHELFIASYNTGALRTHWNTYFCQMVQTIKFKLGDHLKFSVKLPNGDPIRFDKSDADTLIPPDPLLQINAIFSVKKLN